MEEKKQPRLFTWRHGILMGVRAGMKNWRNSPLSSGMHRCMRRGHWSHSGKNCCFTGITLSAADRSDCGKRPCRPPCIDESRQAASARHSGINVRKVSPLVGDANQGINGAEQGTGADALQRVSVPPFGRKMMMR